MDEIDGLEVIPDSGGDSLVYRPDGGDAGEVLRSPDVGVEINDTEGFITQLWKYPALQVVLHCLLFCLGCKKL